MDRCYPSADGNVWVSFPSSERNKVMEGDLLILKKGNGNNDAVFGNSKYKVLAIENEAPDYVKTQRDQVGRIFSDNTQQDEFYIGNPQEGYPIEDMTFFTLDTAQMALIFGDDFLYQLNHI